MDAYAEFCADIATRYAGAEPDGPPLGGIYEGQLDAVLEAFKAARFRELLNTSAIEAHQAADALMRLRYTNPLRAVEHLEDWHGKATTTP